MKRLLLVSVPMACKHLELLITSRKVEGIPGLFTKFSPSKYGVWFFISIWYLSNFLLPIFVHYITCSFWLCFCVCCSISCDFSFDKKLKKDPVCPTRIIVTEVETITKY